MADPGFPLGGGANPRGGRQHTILPNFPKNCMELKEFGLGGGVQNFTMYIRQWVLDCRKPRNISNDFKGIRWRILDFLQGRLRANSLQNTLMRSTKFWVHIGIAEKFPKSAYEAMWSQPENSDKFEQLSYFEKPQWNPNFDWRIFWPLLDINKFTVYCVPIKEGVLLFNDSKSE